MVVLNQNKKLTNFRFITLLVIGSIVDVRDAKGFDAPGIQECLDKQRETIFSQISEHIFDSSNQPKSTICLEIERRVRAETLDKSHLNKELSDTEYRGQLAIADKENEEETRQSGTTVKYNQTDEGPRSLTLATPDIDNKEEKPVQTLESFTTISPRRQTR